MDRPSKLNERLTLIANIAVVLGIVFLAVEIQQNTRAIQAQTRDSITDKQMTFAGWMGTNTQAADVYIRGNLGLDGLDGAERFQYLMLAGGAVREWENSYYQYSRGLFTPEEFEARVVRWVRSMENPGFRDYWELNREAFAPDFRAEIDAIVAEIEGR